MIPREPVECGVKEVIVWPRKQTIYLSLGIIDPWYSRPIFG